MKSLLGRLIKNGSMAGNNQTKGGLKFGPPLSSNSVFGAGYGRGGVVSNYKTQLGPRQSYLRTRKIGQ